MGTSNDLKSARKTSNDITPPDGGWGWMIVLGISLTNICIFAFPQNFGLLFKDRLETLGLGTTAAAFILNLNSSIFNLFGLVTGPLLQRVTFRKMALLGAVVSSLGIMLTSVATELTHLVLAYGVLVGIGFGMILPSSFVVLNMYFLRKRGIAMGLTMTITGLGNVWFPLLIKFLLSEYGFQGTVLILGGLALNAAVGASLFRPLRRCQPKEQDNGKSNGGKEIQSSRICESESLKKSNSDTLLEIQEKEEPAIIRRDSVISIPPKESTELMNLVMHRSTESIAKKSDTKSTGKEAQLISDEHHILVEDDELKGLTKTEVSRIRRTRTMSESSGKPRSRRRRSFRRMSSVEAVSLGNIAHVFEPALYATTNDQTDTEESTKSLEPSRCKKILSCLAKFFDVELLQDYTFVNIVVGLAVTFLAELNFGLLLPLFLSSLGYTIGDIAWCMCILGAADISSRFLVPIITHRFNPRKRVMYLVGAFGSALGRSALTLLSSLPSVMANCVWLGLMKGMRTVFFSLTLSEHVALQKLPTAMGLRMFVNGIIIIILGPLLGYTRDLTGSYIYAIHMTSILTMACVIAWSVDLFYLPTKRYKSTLKSVT